MRSGFVWRNAIHVIKYYTAQVIEQHSDRASALTLADVFLYIY